MSVNSDDTRLHRLLATLESLASGDFDARVDISPAHDDLDAIGYAINVLAEEVAESRAPNGTRPWSA